MLSNIIRQSKILKIYRLKSKLPTRPFSNTGSDHPIKTNETYSIPTRNEMLSKMQIENDFDILVIGGGATGAGAALDAASRGLKVACIEREDFSSGTSSRSTKLLWGGSRYLVQAFVSLLSMNLILRPRETIKKFFADFKMVMSCHRERSFMLRNQPHLTYWQPIAVPLASWLLWPPPFGFFFAALGPLGIFPLFFKFYDALSGFSCPPSHIMTTRRARRKFPQLANNKIKYSPIFYEGMHDDSRTNLAIAQTAAREGAFIINYCEAISFIKEEGTEKIVGATVIDKTTNQKFPINAKSVLFCGGPFTDEIRKLEDPQAQGAVEGAAGIHIVLPSYYAPAGMGMVDMNTSDGRFLFFLPWNDHVLVGTTDHRCDPSMRPVPDESEIKWLLNEASKYLSPELRLRRKDVLSAWSGIRPLAIDPHAKNTASASRDHVVSYNPKTGIVFISGGKWTTFREMAEDAIDKILETNPDIKKKKHFHCKTLDMRFVGFEGYSENLAIKLIQKFEISKSVAYHLAKAYGGRSYEVLNIAFEMNLNATDRMPYEDDYREKLLVPNYPYLEAEIVFAVRHEWAQHPEDILARRTRLAFLNKEAAVKAIPRVTDIMAKELGWSEHKKEQEMKKCIEYMRQFGGPIPVLTDHALRLATKADLKETFKKIVPTGVTLMDRSGLKLASELLNHPLSDAELEDCFTFAKDNGFEDKLSFEVFSEWWNSDRLNPRLLELNKSKMANATQIKGSGTAFS